MNSNNIINVATPLFGHHAATKLYVDDLLNSITGGETGSLQTDIATNTAAIVAMESSYQAADTSLLTDINTRATITYVNTTVASETSARATSESAISAAFAASDATLQTDIDTKAAITYVNTSVASETSARAVSEGVISASFAAADRRILNVSPNLVQNPTGRDGVNGWTNTSNWSTGQTTLGSYITTTTAGAQNIQSNIFTVDNNQTYSFALNAGGEVFNSGVAQVKWRNGSGTVIQTDTISALTSDLDYTRYTNSFVAPDLAVDAYLQIGCTLTSGFFLFFNVKAERSGAPTMYTDDLFYTQTYASISTTNTAVSNNTAAIATSETTLRAEFELADANLTTVIDTKAAITYVDTVISTESAARASADSTLTASVTTNVGNILSNGTAIDANVISIGANASDIIVNTASISTNSTAIATETTARASADTTLTASIGSVSSSVSVNASAIATVDGKLDASYGVTVDGNGRIASMRLLSDGTTSDVKFRADTFSIYNGVSTDVAPFSVSGGVVSMQNVEMEYADIQNVAIATADIVDLNISTIKLEGNAVSQSDYNRSTGSATSAISMDTRSGSVLIHALFYPTSTTTKTYTLKRGGTTLKSFVLNSVSAVTMLFIDTPGTATNVYTAQCSSSCNAIELQILEVLK